MEIRSNYNLNKKELYELVNKIRLKPPISIDDSEKEHMRLTNWKNSPNGKIMKSDVIIAKNYY